MCMFIVENEKKNGAIKIWTKEKHEKLRKSKGKAFSVNQLCNCAVWCGLNTQHGFVVVAVVFVLKMSSQSLNGNKFVASEID